ncbi:MAG TPA: stage 0 sporulation family protein, partial [Myxococcota bacterium]|nr:stage 0 sporulation family protein [Myxococcota bacterium]
MSDDDFRDQDPDSGGDELAGLEDDGGDDRPGGGRRGGGGSGGGGGGGGGRGEGGGGGRGGHRGHGDGGRRTVGLRESRPGAIDPVPLGHRPAPGGPPIVVALVGVQFRDAGRIHAFDSGDRYYRRGAEVVVETDRGQAVGQVVRPTERVVQPADGLLRVLRPADENDRRARQRNAAREQEAFRTCLEMVRAARIDLKLVRAEYAHNGGKVVFYFACEDRVDFRDLARDVGVRLHTRVEMRQIGVRDRSKMVGGIGSCGRDLCCKTWLRDFNPVSIKMAKDQNLALNPQKVSGQCGRLKCCLGYEEDTYREMRRGLPKVGKVVRTPKGVGRVREVDVLRHLVRVWLENESETFAAADVKPEEGAGGAPPARGSAPGREGDREPDRGRERGSAAGRDPSDTRAQAQRYARGGPTPGGGGASGPRGPGRGSGGS